jgi:hypothetical protein
MAPTDEALYAAKAAGRNRCVAYTPEIVARATGSASRTGMRHRSFPGRSLRHK